MAKLTEPMKEMIASQQCFHATVSTKGIPNNSPKRSTRVLDDETLIYNEGTGGRTYDNILRGSKVAVAVVDREVMDGYRFVGTPEVATSGQIYEEAVESSLSAGMPEPIAVVFIKVEEIHRLKPGPMAGRKIS